jgi:hypothetical protein
MYQKCFWCQIKIIKYDHEARGISRLIPESIIIRYRELFETFEYVTI